MTLARDASRSPGSIAQKPHQAGHSWQFLQYLLGFRRLGWDVLFVDRLEVPTSTPPDAAARPRHRGRALALGLMADVRPRRRVVGGARRRGPRRRPARARCWSTCAAPTCCSTSWASSPTRRSSAAARQRVFLDTDPGFGQMWRALGLADVFAGPRRARHDRRADRARGLHDPDLRPRLDHDAAAGGARAWPAAPPPPREDFTTVARWRGAYGPVDYDGRRYGLRVHEFRKFADLPRDDGRALRARARHPSRRDRRPRPARRRRLGSRRPARGRATRRAPTARYIEGSAAEFMVAKGMYVESRSGWFSERSICYLATGRPVLAQDTGLADLYPGRRGPAHVLDARRGGGRRGGDPLGLRPARRARRARSPRSTSTPTRCSAGCSSSSRPPEHDDRRRQRRRGQQAPPGRQHLGAHELGGGAARRRLRRAVRRADRRGGVRGRGGRAARASRTPPTWPTSTGRWRSSASPARRRWSAPTARASTAWTPATCSPAPPRRSCS